MRPPLNLATRPFRNQNLPRILLVLGWAGLVVLTVQHALVLRRLMPSRTTALHREVSELEAQLGATRDEVARMREARPDPAQRKRWSLVKDLVDRRTMSWTGLLAVLEEVLPHDVRLLAITPSVQEGTVRLELTAVVQSTEAGLAFARVLEQRPEFENVVPESTTATRDTEEEVRYRMWFRPGAVAVPAAQPSPADEAVEEARGPRRARGEAGRS